MLFRVHLPVLLVAFSLAHIPTSVAAKILSGKITNWRESGAVLTVGNGTLFIWWSINRENRGWFYGSAVSGEGRVEVAHATGIKDIEQIENARLFEYTNTSVGPLCDADCNPEGVGEFVVWRNRLTRIKHYFVLRIDDIVTVGGDLRHSELNATWWYQTEDNNPAFDSFPRLTLDIKPGSCRNPINPRSRGILTMALLGTQETQMSAVDMTTLLLEDALAPIRWNFDDVSTPPIQTAICACSGLEPDGNPDVILKFRNQDVVQLLQPEDALEEPVLTLSGTFNDGTFFRAQNCVEWVGGRRSRSIIALDGVPGGTQARTMTWTRIKTTYR